MTMVFFTKLPYELIQYMTQKMTLGDFNTYLLKPYDKKPYLSTKNQYISPISTKSFVMILNLGNLNFSILAMFTPDWIFTVSFYTH